MRRILITGSTGGIGSQIVESLAGEETEFFLQYFNEKKKSEKEGHLKRMPGKINFVRADLTNEEQINEMLGMILNKGGADVIIHCV